MKKKNAFTLIELLAIIIILAIIFVITVPVIMRVIENSRKGAAEQSAVNYKDAVQKFYASKIYKNRTMKLDGTYTVEDGKLTGIFMNDTEETKEIEVSGKKPVNGTMIYENNKFISGCLTFGEYKVELNEDETITTTKGDCSIVPDITGGLRERVLTLYANEIASAQNYFIVYRNNFQSADLILYYNSNFSYQIRIVEPSDPTTDIPTFRLYIPEINIVKNDITMDDDGGDYAGGERWYTANLQFWEPGETDYLEMFGYPSNIDSFQTYKKFFGKIITGTNNKTIKLDEVLTLPSSYNNTTCRDYMVLTYNGNAQFYCITGDAGFTYDTSNKNLIFNYNNGHMYRYKYNTDNWNIVFDADVDWSGLYNNDYKNHDILDIIVLSTFDIKDANNNIVYPKNTTMEKLTTNYTAQ